MSSGHLPLLPRCGACADTILRHERVVALSGNEGSTAYDGRTRPFPFPQPGMVPTIVNDRSLCRRTGCEVCARAPEFIPAHCECYGVYVQESALDEDEALIRLWVAGAWRSPWAKAPLVHLQTAPIDRDALEGMADHVAARGLAARLSATSPEQLLRVPLSAVSSWERGGQLIRASSDCPPWVRITIDTGGISKVERLPERPSYNGAVTEHLAFIVEDVTDIDVDVEIKNGLLRLRRPESQQALRIWNTPAPPDPTTSQFRPMEDVTWQRLFAVDLKRTRGLTFLFIRGAPYGVHVHRLEESCAVDTCERFPNRTRLGLVWVYLPVAAEDRVLVVGTRKTELGPSILVRTQLVGDVILGCLGQRVEQDRLLGSGGRITLIYGEPEEQRHVSVLGASCPPPSKSRGLPPPFPLQDFKPEPEGAYFSWAPLAGVLSARTLYDADSGLCRGILFRYENGGERAVGQCRLGADRRMSVLRPTRVCLRDTTYLTRLRKQERAGVEVEFGAGGEACRHGEGWRCLALRGVMKFSFTAYSSYVSVEDYLAEE